MATYLERYLAGQHEVVWDELFAFGDELREGPYYHDALEVARETMRRVRHNIEMLIPRLVRFGYRFGYDWLIQPPIDEPFDTLHYQLYLDALQWVREQPPTFISAIQRDEHFAHLVEVFGQNATTILIQDDEIKYLPPSQMKDLVPELDEIVGGLPLSVYAWYEQVGSVNLVGSYSPWVTLYKYIQGGYAEIYDPLFMEPLMEDRLEYFRERRRRLDFLALAPAQFFKHHISGGGMYGVRIPSGAADAIFQGQNNDLTFVQYLRLCFRWAGFPGMAQLAQPPLADIAQLTEGFNAF